MEYYNNQLCVEAMWLVENEVFNYDQYKYLTRTRQMNVVRKACRNTPALVSYDSIPERFKPAIRDILGDVYAAARVSQVEQHIEHDAAMSDYFEDFTLTNGRKLPQATRIEYYNNAIILNAIGSLLTDKTTTRRSLGGKVAHRWDEIAEGIQELDRSKYPHSLPANERSLERRFRRFKKEGPESLIHRNYQNQNAASIDDKVKESYIQELLRIYNNLNDTQVARLYNVLADKMDWKQITPATVGVWRKKMDLTTYAGRRGVAAFHNKKSMQVRRSAPSAPMLYWTVDGWDVELLYQDTGKNGVTTYHNRPTVVVVLDTSVNYPIGYAVGTHETPELIQQALRNAARHTQELFGKMYRVNQIQSDRYAIKKMTPFYETVAKKVTPARARNAKAKAIEPYFARFNKKWCQLMQNWAGFGITSNREKQPNAEFLNKNKKNFPDFEGVIRQIEMMIDRERQEVVGRFMELWNQLGEKHKVELPKASYLLQFGETTSRSILMQSYGLAPRLKGQRRYYDSFDLSFRDNSAVRWNVMYDPDDFTEILAVNEDGSLQYLLEEKHVQPMALADRADGDSEQLERVRKFNEELEETITGRLEISGNIVRNHMKNKRLTEHETLSKLLLTDSRGQHKNQKSLARHTQQIEDAEIINDENLNFWDKY